MLPPPRVLGKKLGKLRAGISEAGKGAGVQILGAGEDETCLDLRSRTWGQRGQRGQPPWDKPGLVLGLADSCGEMLGIPSGMEKLQERQQAGFLAGGNARSTWSPKEPGEALEEAEAPAELRVQVGV